MLGAAHQKQKSPWRQEAEQQQQLSLQQTVLAQQVQEAVGQNWVSAPKRRVALAPKEPSSSGRFKPPLIPWLRPATAIRPSLHKHDVVVARSVCCDKRCISYRDRGSVCVTLW